MKIRRIIFIGLGIILSLFPAKAQRSGFFFGVDAVSANAWTAAGIQVIGAVANVLIDEMYDGDGIAPAIGGNSSYDIMRFRENGTNVLFNPEDWYGLKTTFGFKKRYLFSHLNGNLKFGWMGPYSPIGAYVHVGYDYRWFAMRMSYQTEAQDYKIGTFNPGVGIRISPANFYYSASDTHFVIEVGTNYNHRKLFRSPYENKEMMLNNGLSYIVSLGLAGESNSVLLGFEWANHDLFNKDYTPDNGLSHPYYNLSSKIMSLILSINYGF